MGSRTTVYTYDGLGRQNDVKEYSGGSPGTLDRTTTYSYDPVTGGITQVAAPEGTINYEYQLSTGRLVRTWTTSNDTRYGYDKLGRLQTVFVSKRNDATPTSSEQTSYAYDLVGNLDTVTLPNGVVSDYGYDPLNIESLLTNMEPVELADDGNQGSPGPFMERKMRATGTDYEGIDHIIEDGNRNHIVSLGSSYHDDIDAVLKKAKEKVDTISTGRVFTPKKGKPGEVLGADFNRGPRRCIWHS